MKICAIFIIFIIFYCKYYMNLKIIFYTFFYNIAISALTIPEIYAQAPAASQRLRDKGDNVSADELDDLVVKLKQDQEALRIAAGIFPPDESLLNYIIGLMQTHQKRAEVLIKLSNQL